MKLFLPAIFLPALFLFANVASAQNVYRDYVVDKHAQYSPTDQTDRGLIYRIQTGHAGFFAQCDDEPARLYSPYIQWPCRNDLHYNRLADWKKGCERRIQRLIDGAGDCITGDCSGCCKEDCAQCCDADTSLRLAEVNSSDNSVAAGQEQKQSRSVIVPKSANSGKITDFQRR